MRLKDMLIKKKEEITEKDRQMVLFALSSQEPAEKGTCPSPEELALFTDGALESQEREAILVHLNACPECYNDWLEISSILTEKPPFSFAFVIEQITQFFKFFITQQKKYVIPAFSTAAACLFIFLLWTFFQTPKIGNLIAKSYPTSFLKKLTLEPDIYELPWEGTNPYYGFDSSNQYAPPYRAFGAGLWEARQMLKQQTSDSSSMPDFLSPRWNDKIKSDKWEETQWQVYFQMGKWSFLMRSVCLSDAEIPPGFQEEQKHILEKIKKDFAECSEKNEEDTKIINDKFSSIKNILNDSDKTLNTQERIKIVRELEQLIRHFSPKQMPTQD